jgi:hypothetical protein
VSLAQVTCGHSLFIKAERDTILNQQWFQEANKTSVIMLSLVELVLSMDSFYSIATLVQKLKTYCIETLSKHEGCSENFQREETEER